MERLGACTGSTDGTDRRRRAWTAPRCGIDLPEALEADRRQRVHDRHPGLPGPVHAQREASYEVLRRGDHPRRPADPVLRLQLRRLPGTGARAAHAARRCPPSCPTPASSSRSCSRPAYGSKTVADGAVTGNGDSHVKVEIDDDQRRAEAAVTDRGARPARRPSRDPLTGRAAIDADEVKACCAAALPADVVALILGESYHPGGLELTRRLAGQHRLGPGSGCSTWPAGPAPPRSSWPTSSASRSTGSTWATLAVAKANARAAERGLADRVRFHLGDAERCRCADGSFDAVVCECAFCTFPDKATAAAEMARVLRPAAGSASPTSPLDPERLDAELRTLAGWVACLADARPSRSTSRLLGRRRPAGHPHRAPRRRAGGMVDQIDARLRRVPDREGAGAREHRLRHGARSASPSPTGGAGRHRRLLADRRREAGVSSAIG